MADDVLIPQQIRRNDEIIRAQVNEYKAGVNAFIASLRARQNIIAGKEHLNDEHRFLQSIIEMYTAVNDSHNVHIRHFDACADAVAIMVRDINGIRSAMETLKDEVKPVIDKHRQAEDVSDWADGLGQKAKKLATFIGSVTVIAGAISWLVIHFKGGQ